MFEFHRDKRDVLVVSSGAIALGRAVLKLPAGPLKLETRIGNPIKVPLWYYS